MESVEEILQSCRLCLVKEQVNIPIFEESSDLRKISEKINSCLPVKVAKDDNLPKKICDGCSYKLDMVYLFRNTSVDSEKQLIQWLTKAGLTNTIFNSEKDAKTSEILVKQESYDGNEVQNDLGADAHTYIMQQQKLPYQQDFAFPESSAANEEENGPLPKRPKRESAAKKKPPIVESEEEDDDDDDDFDNSMDVPKAEDNYSDEEEDRTDFDAPSTSADAQPGPSGVGTSEAPSLLRKTRLRQKGLAKNKKLIKKELSKSKKRNKTTKSRIWTCQKCLVEFSTRKELMKHKKIHFKVKEETETINNFTFDPLLGIFVCGNCSAEFKSEEEVQKHVNEKHVEQYTCDTCLEVFKNAYTFSCHMQSHTEEQFFTCPLCSFSTIRRTCILTHINTMHYNKFYYNCKTCGKGFMDSVRFKEHENEHLGIKPFVCPVCSKAFVFSRYLLQHQIQYHTVGYEGQFLKNQCELCLRIFFRKASYERHMVSRHNTHGPREKKHLCDICGKGFVSTDKMKIHYRLHTGDKPYACQFCPKSFIKKDYLITHERVHTGEKPFSCEFCGKCFNQTASLRIHIRGHTGERPYICQFCNNGFISKGVLNLHQKVCMGCTE